jgi:hypothetical protein
MTSIFDSQIGNLGFNYPVAGRDTISTQSAVVAEALRNDTHVPSIRPHTEMRPVPDSRIAVVDNSGPVHKIVEYITVQPTQVAPTVLPGELSPMFPTAPAALQSVRQNTLKASNLLGLFGQAAPEALQPEIQETSRRALFSVAGTAGPVDVPSEFYDVAYFEQLMIFVNRLGEGQQSWLPGVDEYSKIAVQVEGESQVHLVVATGFGFEYAGMQFRFLRIQETVQL